MAAQKNVLGLDIGEEAINLARDSMESYVVNGKREYPGSMVDTFYNRIGAFVILNSTRGRRSVRGSAGSYLREKQFSEAIVDAAIEASSSSSGRSEIRKCELDAISVTLCAVHSVDILEGGHPDIEIGRHGLIVERGSDSGWMLPHMPVEYDWSETEFLDRTCCKAGLGRGAWMSDDVVIHTFEGQIFREKEPNGEVEEIALSEV